MTLFGVLTAVYTMTFSGLLLAKVLRLPEHFNGVDAK